MGLSCRSILDCPGMAPSLLFHSLEQLLKMAPAAPVPTFSYSSWVRSECTGKVVRVICMKYFKTTGLPQRDKQLIMAMAVLNRRLTFEASHLKYIPHWAGAAYGGNSLQYLDLQRKYWWNPIHPVNGKGNYVKELFLSLSALAEVCRWAQTLVTNLISRGQDNLKALRKP